jgi:methanogenic corrinoid protein MtbC1
MEKILEELHEGVLNGDMDVAREKVQAALDAGLEPAAILRI